MKVDLYVRVSTEEQLKEGFSINAQLEKLKAFCFSQGWKINKIYIEEGKSAKDLNRPKLQELLTNLSVPDVVLVYKLDRISRSVGDINYLLNTFESNGVAFKSATEPYDTTTSQGKLLINIFASLAQFEREQLAERTRFGMERRHEEGKRNGGRAPFGYELVDGELVINEEEAKWVRYIFKNFLIKGKTAIAAALNEMGVKSRVGTNWNDSMVHYLASNPVYKGYLRWNYRQKSGTRTYDETIVKGTHDPIVSEEEFEAIKQTRRNRKHTKVKGKTTYPFSGKLICNRCGYKLAGEKRKRKDGTHYRYYKCTGRSHYGVCDLPIVAEDEVEKEFMNRLQYVTPDDLEVNDDETDFKEIEKQLKRVRNRITNTKELYIDGDLTKQEYREKLEIEEHKEAELTQLLSTKNESVNLDNINAVIDNLKTNWFNLTLDERKQVISTLFESFTIDALGTHTGGKGVRTPIEINDYALR